MGLFVTGLSQSTLALRCPKATPDKEPARLGDFGVAYDAGFVDICAVDAEALRPLPWRSRRERQRQDHHSRLQPRQLRAEGMGILKIGRTIGIGTSVVQRVLIGAR